MQRFRGEVRTDEQGRYSLRVYGEQAYILTASKDNLAAPYLSGVVVRAGTPKTDVDLILGPATRVHGKVTEGADQKPVADIGIEVKINQGSIPDELKPEGDRYARQMVMSFYEKTNKSGQYQFLLGPGRYKIQSPAHNQLLDVDITIAKEKPQKEVLVDFSMPKPQFVPFTAKAVDSEGMPVANAVFVGAYQAPLARFTETKSDAQGKISIYRSTAPLVLVARTSDKMAGGILNVDADATDATVVIKKTASMTAVLVDEDGKPLADRKLTYGIRVPAGIEKDSPFGFYFGGTITTDEKGGFRLDGLLLGETYSVYWMDQKALQLRMVQTKVYFTEPGAFDLGEVRLSEPPQR